MQINTYFVISGSFLTNLVFMCHLYLVTSVGISCTVTLLIRIVNQVRCIADYAPLFLSQSIDSVDKHVTYVNASSKDYTWTQQVELVFWYVIYIMYIMYQMTDFFTCCIHIYVWVYYQTQYALDK